MDFNTTIEIIIKDLKQVREIIDDFKNYQGVPLLQVELAKAKCKSAEEIISLLKVVKAESGAIAAENLKPVPQEPSRHEDTLIEISEEETESEVSTTGTSIPGEMAEKTGGHVFDGGSVAGSALPVADFKPEEPEKTLSSPRPAKAEKQILADNFNGVQQTFLDQFGTDAGDGTSHLIKDRAITNLSDAIGVNDRFLYIREVFGGDRQAYEDAISRLDKVASYDEAMKILLEFAPEGDYNEHVNGLLDIIKRKLPADG